MTEGQVLDIARQALYTIILCSAPLLIISLVVGLVVSNRRLPSCQRLSVYFLE